MPKESWSVEPVIYNDCEKVKEVPGYPGLFMNHQGKVFDLRPSETCPCFDYYFRKSKRELNGILLEALEKQLEVLNKQPKIDTDLQKDLRREIETYRKHA